MNNTFERRQVHSAYFGTDSLSLLGPEILDLVPLGLKQLESLEVFKLKIKKWIPFADCVELIYDKLCLFKAESLTMIIDCYYHFFYHLRCLCDNIYISKLVNFLAIYLI